MCVCVTRCSVADIHLAVLVIVGGEGGEADWLAVQRAQVHQTGRPCAAEFWDSYQEDILTVRTWDGEVERETELER